MNIGDTIYHPRFGECELQQIFNAHSTPLVVAVVKREIECLQAGQPICRDIDEFSEEPFNS